MKPIYLTPEDKDAMMAEFTAQLNKTNLFDGSFSYVKKYYFDPKTTNIPKARILYTPMAYVKMLKLIQEFASEIAWHGLVLRGDDEGDFIVYDIITHKQYVTGSTVNTDDAEYEEFMRTLPDEIAENMFMQAHSHVNFQTNPSATDIAHQSKIVSQMSGRKNKKFQIFQIWNKSLQCTSMIYDFANNIYYENNDIIVDVLFDYKEDILASNFVQEARRLVVQRSYQQPKNNTTTNTTQPKKEENNSAKKADEKPKQINQGQRGFVPWWEKEDLEDVDFDKEFFERHKEYLESVGYFN